MGDWIKNLLLSGGYPVIAGLMFVENVFPPIPSELIMPLAGFHASTGKLSIWGVILAGMIGSLLGQLPLYYLGKVVGEDRLKTWADKHGKWIGVSGDDITKAHEWFDKHGTKSVVFARVVPGVRSLVSIPAGFTNMPLVPFLLYSAIGTGAVVGRARAHRPRARRKIRTRGQVSRPRDLRGAGRHRAGADRPRRQAEEGRPGEAPKTA
jgi:membrane protein DedA with SNARE-associated domain